MSIQEASSHFLRRRFPRVFLTSSMMSQMIPGLNVIWGEERRAPVYDFGRTSVSMYLPMRMGLLFSKSDVLKLDFEIAGIPNGEGQFSIESRVMRSESRHLCAEILRLSHSGNQLLKDFFTPQILAQSSIEVDTHDIAPEQTFQKWIHGPMDTNLYAWLPRQGEPRFVLEIGSFVIGNESGQIWSGDGRDTLSYPTEDYTYYSTTLVERGAPNKDAIALAKTYLSSLSHEWVKPFQQML